jgi:hypothetical protein
LLGPTKITLARIDSWDSTLKMILRQSYLHLKLDLKPLLVLKVISNLKIKVNTRFALNAFQGDCFNFSCFAQKIEIFSPKFLKLKIVQIAKLIYMSFMQAENE